MGKGALSNRLSVRPASSMPLQQFEPSEFDHHHAIGHVVVGGDLGDRVTLLDVPLEISA